MFKYTSNNLEVKVSGKTSNKSEKSENSDEKKLETISVKSKDKVVSLDIVTNEGNISPALCGSTQESGELCALVTLNNGKSILVSEFSAVRESCGTALSSLSVKCRVTLDLKTSVSEIGNLVWRRGCLVSSSGCLEADLACLLCERRVRSLSDSRCGRLY